MGDGVVKMETVRYNYRLRPGATATALLMDEWHRCRWLWNQCVDQWRTGRHPTLGRLSKRLTEARGRTSWLRKGSQSAQQQVIRTFMRALSDSFTVKGRGRPKYKSHRWSRPSVEYSSHGFAISDGRLILAKGITLPVVWSRELPSAPSSVRVYRDSLGDWYASFVVRRHRVDGPIAHESIGVDWGVTATATTTDYVYDLPHSEHRKQCAGQRGKAQRKMARRRRKGHVPQSNGYKRAKREAAKIERKAKGRVQHEARMWAKHVVDDHELIAVEDFKPKFLKKSKMAKKAFDAAIGMTKRTLIEQAKRAGRTVVIVPPAHTTMTCSQCSTIAKRPFLLDERIFGCWACGYTAGRDRNAARTILVTAEQIRASADGIRHLQPPPAMESDEDAA